VIERLGSYLVERKLADGGMGSVYKAIAPDGRPVVLKVPHSMDRNAMIALADEARTGARLLHPGIVETLDFFEHERKYVLVVEYIDGVTLFELRRQGALPPEAVVDAGLQLASALDAIHTATDESGRPLNIIHRDVSPNNVIVDTSGQLKLIDLGIARSSERRQKATMHGMVKGTLRYLAPEIVAGADHGPATDLWALGVTLWEAAVGRYAVDGDEVQTVRAAMEGTLMQLRPGEYVDGAVLEVLGALIAPADRRLQNARAARNVFGRFVANMPGGREALARAVGAVRARSVVVQDSAKTELIERMEVTEQLPAATLQPSVFTSETQPDDTAPTLQMPMWTPPVDANAPTRIQPAVQVQAGPAKSLFLPIVVVDELEEE
jgi:serine/threonine protein kinase